MPRSFFGKNKEYIGNDEFYTQEEDFTQTENKKNILRIWE